MCREAKKRKGQKLNTALQSYLMIFLCYGPKYAPFSLSHTQRQQMPSTKQGKACQLNVCNALSSKENWESPVKLLELFPNANMCYQINKATKDANREIRAAVKHLLGGKEMKHFHQSFAPCFLHRG